MNFLFLKFSQQNIMIDMVERLWRNPTNRFAGMIQGHQMLRTTCQQEVNKCYGSARLSLAVSQTEGGV